jgi:hypothetical protein
MTSLYRFDYERLNENSLQKASLEYAETANRDDPKLRIVAIRARESWRSKTAEQGIPRPADQGDPRQRTKAIKTLDSSGGWRPNHPRVAMAAA